MAYSRFCTLKFKVPGTKTLLIIPLELVLNLLLTFPFVLAIYFSFVSWSPLMGIPWTGAPFVGFKNYVEILQFPRFLSSVRTTILLVATVVSAEFLLGLGLALLLQRAFTGKKIVISILLMPMMMLPLVVGLTFSQMFYKVGPINQILSIIAGSNVGIDWINGTSTALFAIVVADIWEWTPFMFLVLYAGIVALPEEQFRAAKVLGASNFNVFRYLTFPMLRPVLYVAIFIRTIEALKMFDVPFIMTDGGPGTTTETISVFMYNYGITFMRLSFIAAGAMLILVAVVIVTMFAARPLLPKAVKELER